MARDGWIKLGPGEQIGFHVDVGQTPSMIEVQDFISRVRGAMLSVAWSVERQLGVIIEHRVLGGASTEPSFASDTGRAFLQDELIVELPFGRKARLAKAIAFLAVGFDAATFTTRLDDVVLHRNALAHGLASLIPISNHSEGFCTGFSAHLEHKASSWDLTEALAGKWLEEAHQCLAMTDELTRRLSD